MSAAAAGAAPLDAALALLQQGGGGGSGALPAAEDAPGEQPKRYFTLQAGGLCARVRACSHVAASLMCVG